MTITYTWKVTQMDCYPELDGETDVVFTVYWTLNGFENSYYANSYGSIGVTLDASAPFTPYDQLTEEQVLGWIWSSGVNKDEQEALIAQQIQSQINPTVVTPPLPWLPPLPA